MPLLSSASSSIQHTMTLIDLAIVVISLVIVVGIGVHWTKPNVGLVEYGGNRNNNLVLMEPRLGTVNVKVLFEPDDPDPYLNHAENSPPRRRLFTEGSSE